MKNKLEQILIEYPDIDFVKLPNKFDGCIIGVGERYGIESHIIYDRDKILKVLLKETDEDTSLELIADMLAWYYKDPMPTIANII